ncbi:MAG: ribosome maturation factor RimP [Deltaproteobacteria bacterium]
MTELINKIRGITLKKFLEPEFDDCYIVEICISKNNKIEIFIDSDSDMTINKCASISRFVDKEIEDALLINEKYTLEVSSPGLNRPLVKRQFSKNTGRFIRIKTKDHLVIEGILSFVDDKKIIVEIENKKDIIKNELSFDEIEEAKIIFKFNKR